MPIPTRLTGAFRIMSAVLVVVLACAAAGQSKRPLTNGDVIKLVNDGFTDDVVVAMIEANDSAYDVSLDGLKSLKAAGIGSPVMQAILKAEAQKRQSPSAAPPAPQAAAPMPQAPMIPPMMAGPGGAFVQQLMGMMSGGGGGGGGMVDPSQLPPLNLIGATAPLSVRPSIAQVASTETKGDGMPGAGSQATGMLMGLGRQALRFGAVGSMFAGPGAGIAMGMMGGLGGMGHRHGPPKVTYVWALPGPQSTLSATDLKPRFEMSYGNLLGIDPDAYEPQLIKLVESRDNWRLVGATKTPMGQIGTEAWEKITEARIGVETQRMERGHVQIVPKQPLEPGEYAVVLRAIHPGKRAEGSLGGGMEPGIFFAVWDFSVGKGERAARP
jgi:hypothetical protein